MNKQTGKFETWVDCQEQGFYDYDQDFLKFKDFVFV